MDATLEVPLGKTAVLAGLIQEQSDREASGTHLVGMVFLITPHLVEAAAPVTASLPTPADSR
jgi:Flp pilus assembly secretin CpaC